MKKKKVKNEKTRSLPRFGALDALIILIVIVLIVGIFFRYKLMDILTSQQNFDEYNIAFTVDNVRYTTPDYINVGDTFYFANGGDALGTVTNDSENVGALTVAPAAEMFTDSNGNIIEVHYPNETRVSFSGNLLCKGSVSETGGILINGSTYVAPGQTINVRTELVTMTLKVINIEKK